MKLFSYSHHFQNKLDFSLFDYQKKYFDKIGKKIEEYLSDYTDQFERYPSDFSEDNLRKRLIKDGDTFNINSIINYVINYYMNYYKKNENDLNIYIDFYSPFFNIFAKDDKFWDKFTIPINIELITNNGLKTDYISFFENMNKSNSNYSLLFNYNRSSDIKYLKEFQINFNKVKKLTVRPIPVSSKDFKTYLAYEDYSQFNYFLNTLFSLNGIENSLVYLNIQILSCQKKSINENSVLNLNNFKSLKHLELTNMKFENPFTLKLSNLKKLVLNKISNINLTEINNLNDLIIYNSSLSPELFTSNSSEKKCEIMMSNFSGINNLNYYEGDANYFLFLKSENIEKVKLFLDKEDNFEMGRDIIKKIISLKNLKEFYLNLQKRNESLINNIIGENKSVTKIELNLESLESYNTYELINFQKQFPNLSDFNIVLPNINNSSFWSDLEIIEDTNCKIDKLRIKGDIKGIKLLSGAYEKLLEFDLHLNGKIRNIKNVLPIFNENSKIIFQSLTNLKFHITFLELSALNSLFENLYNIPNLRHFELYCKSDENPTKFEELFETLNKKIKSMKLDYINIDIY